MPKSNEILEEINSGSQMITTREQLHEKEDNISDNMSSSPKNGHFMGKLQSDTDSEMNYLKEPRASRFSRQNMFSPLNHEESLHIPDIHH